MPFFKESVLKDKQGVTLQVQSPFRIIGFFAKRVLSSAFEFSKKGSLTLEASLILPLFLFSMILMMMPMEIMNEARRVQTSLESAGETVSQYAYVLEQINQGKKVNEVKEELDFKLSEQLTETGVLLYVRNRVEEQVHSKRVADISFVKSSFMEDGETIDLVMNYRICLPFSVFGLKSVPMTARSCRRAWIGKEGVSRSAGGEEEEFVYIGRGSQRYHRLRTCHYLYNDLQERSLDQVKDLRNRSGGKYKPCERCKKELGFSGKVYVMPWGEKYHTDKNCSSIISYVSTVPLSQVRHLGPCSYCSQQEVN